MPPNYNPLQAILNQISNNPNFAQAPMDMNLINALAAQQNPQVGRPNANIQQGLPTNTATSSYSQNNWGQNNLNQNYTPSGSQYSNNSSQTMPQSQQSQQSQQSSKSSYQSQSSSSNTSSNTNRNRSNYSSNSQNDYNNNERGGRSNQNNRSNNSNNNTSTVNDRKVFFIFEFVICK